MVPYCLDMRKLSAPPQQPLLKREEIALRWQCHEKTVRQRMKALGIKAIRLGHRSIRYRLEDVLLAEAQCR
jgi:hypothetical protein